MESLMNFEGKHVEILVVGDNIYFNPYDVGRCLELSNSAVRMAMSKMTENQVVLLKNSDVNKFDIRKLNNAGERFLTDSGVYKLVFKSNKPKAEEFADWVADDVLPSIRKTGKYEMAITKSDEAEMFVDLKKTKAMLYFFDNADESLDILKKGVKDLRTPVWMMSPAFISLQKQRYLIIP